MIVSLHDPGLEKEMLAHVRMLAARCHDVQEAVIDVAGVEPLDRMGALMALESRLHELEHISALTRQAIGGLVTHDQ